MGSHDGGARGGNAVWRWRWILLSFCLIIAGCAETFPTTFQDNENSADKDGLSSDKHTSGLLNANASETASFSTAVKQESDSSEKHVGFPSAEVSEAPSVEQDVSDARNENERVARLDYYDDMQLPRGPEEDDAPVLPEHAVNVNEDYAGIYDYRGSPDGRYRRKRTLTTNIEQLLTRSSRLNRMGRSISDNSLLEITSPGERAEKLVSLMRVLQDADPAFDANDFLKVLHAPSVSEQDLEYLIYLSNIAALTDTTNLPPQASNRNFDFKNSESYTPEEEQFQADPAYSAWSHLSLPELVDIALMQQQQQKQRKRPSLQQLSESFSLAPDLVLLNDSNTSSKRQQASKPSSTSSKDFSRLFAIAAMMAQQQEDPAGIAM